jgi:hypothetical protein
MWPIGSCAGDAYGGLRRMVDHEKECKSHGPRFTNYDCEAINDLKRDSPAGWMLQKTSSYGNSGRGDVPLCVEHLRSGRCRD